MSDFDDSVTTNRPFCSTDGYAVFCVNAGTPVNLALEQAAQLSAYLEHLTQQQGALDAPIERGLLQTLAEMTRALLDASQPQDPEMFQHGLRQVASAKADLAAQMKPPATPRAK